MPGLDQLVSFLRWSVGARPAAYRGRAKKRFNDKTSLGLRLEPLEGRQLLAVVGTEPAVTGRVFVDMDGDAAYTAGEEVEGASVQLFADDGDGVFDTSVDTQVGVDAITDINGDYCFGNLDGNERYFVFQPEQTVSGNLLAEQVSSLINPVSPDILIDDFEDPRNSTPGERQVVASSNGSVSDGRTTALTDETHIIGVERDFLAQLVSGVGEFALRIDFDGQDDLLRVATTAAAVGTGTLTWDGQDNDAGTVSLGLNGRDLTNGGANSGIILQVGIDAAGAGEMLTLRLFQGSDTNVSTAMELLPVTPGGAAESFVFIPFSSFSGPVTPDNVDAIQLQFSGAAIDGEVEFIGVLGPQTADFLNLPEADLAITKSNSSTTLVPGETVNYTILVENLGPNDALGAQVVDTFDPDQFTDVSYTSTTTGGASGNTVSGTGNINDTVDLPDGATITYLVTATVDPSSTGTLMNTANVQPPTQVPDPDPSNNVDTEDDSLTPNVDLQVTKDNGVDAIAPGSTLDYTIVVTNNGPSNVTGAIITDNFSTQLTDVSFTSTATGGATGNTATSAANVTEINDTVNMPVGSTITYIVTSTVDSNATGTLTNTATVTAPAGVTDTDPTNNTAQDIDTLGNFDLVITKTDNETTVVPGQTVQYEIVVSNSGPDDVTGATVEDLFPASLTNVSYTSATTGTVTGNTASGTGDISDVVDMQSGSTISYTVVATVVSSATGTLVNTATVTAAAGQAEANTANNTATDTDVLQVEADLEVIKTDDGLTTVTPGGTVDYTITVQNNGPSDVVGATFDDPFPTEFSNVTYTSVSSGGATGATASGSGDINDTLDLPVGSSVVYSASAIVAATASGAVTNTATVTAPQDVVETDVTNNSDSDSVTVQDSQVDLSITKDDGVATVSPGDQVDYEIVVTNVGSVEVVDAVITDDFPDSLTNVTFTSQVVTGTASGNTASGTGDINDTVTIGVGAEIRYDVTATVSNDAVGTIDNVASVDVPANVVDVDTSNNSDTDSDTVIREIDLSIDKTNNVTAVNSGDDVTYTIVVTNNGPSDASGVTITDDFPDGDLENISFTSQAFDGATGNTASGTGDINDTVDMPNGSRIEYTVTATVRQNTDDDELTNTAVVAAPVDLTDTNPNNNTSTDNDPIDGQPGGISGFVYFDLDDDGVFDANESPIENVEIILQQNGTEIDRTTTDATGAYAFAELDPGDYMVLEIQPARANDGRETVGGGIGTVTGNDEFTVPLGVGDNATELNFGERIAQPSKRDLLASSFAN